jgi:DNA-binding LacI/PurR family transcriptional regulator
VWPSLTTVRQPVSDMAECAAEMVIQASRLTPPNASERPSVITLAYEVILRSSSGSAPA